MKVATLQYPAHTSKSGYRPLEQACLAIGLLHNSIIKLQVRNPGPGRIEYDRKATGRHITELLSNAPECQGYAHKFVAGDSSKNTTGHTLQVRHCTEARQ